MIVYGSILIAVIFSIILWFKFKQQVVWWEPLIIIGVAVGLSFGSKALIEHSQVTFTELWGSEVVSVYESEPWNEWVTQTCSREYACGSDSDGNTTYCTEYYDCSYQDDHGPRWYCVTTSGEDLSITEAQYDKWMAQFGAAKTITKTRSNHASRDRCSYSSGSKFAGKKVGSKSYIYRTDWNGDYTTSVPVTTEHTYENRIKASDYSVFNYIELSEEEVASNNLYEYPELNSNFYPKSILGSDNNYYQKLIHKVNGHTGPDAQCRVWILLHDTDDSEVGYLQENYWVGGNKNELVINIGVDSMSQVNWCHVFSWSNSAGLKDEIVKYVESLDQMNDTVWADFSIFLKDNIDKDWERLEFTQFSYLSVDPPLWSIILVYVLTLLVSGAISIWVVRNEFEHRGESKSSHSYNRNNRNRFRRY